MLYSLLRHLLFCFPPERSHEISLKALDFLAASHLQSVLFPKPEPLPVEVMGIRFPNPVGLAAGLDKNGDHIRGLASLGFGFVELGTVTPKPQPGNDKPRLFRLVPEQAIINRMGFNNLGVDHLVNQVEKARAGHNLPVPVGINIGKNIFTSVEDAWKDYCFCLEKVYDVADYIVVNISSPNTPGLRSLQFGQQLEALLDKIKTAHSRLSAQQRYVPLVVKIAPDGEEEGFAEIARQLMAFEIDGVTVSNTTLDREAVAGSPFASEAGGLSGKPLKPGADRALSLMSGLLDGRIPLIGVGGIHSGQDAADKIRLGASLVQVYTGFIYEGPSLIRDCVDAIRQELADTIAAEKQR